MGTEAGRSVTVAEIFSLSREHLRLLEPEVELWALDELRDLARA